MGTRRSALSLQIYAVFWLIQLASVFAGVFAISNSVREDNFKEKESFLLGRAHLFERRFLDQFPKGIVSAEVSKFCVSFGEQVGIPLMLLNPSGRILADSEVFSNPTEDLSSLPEIRSAMSGQTGRDVRFHPPEQKNILFVAIPVIGKQGMVCIVRTFSEVPPWPLFKMAAIIFVIASLTALLSFWVWYRLSRPIREMRHGVDRFAKGELAQRWTVPNSREMGDLAHSLNQMASQFDEKIQSSTRQQNEQTAILSSMMEGVLALDMEERVILVNASVFRIFGLPHQKAKGRSIQEVIRNVDLHRFVEKTMASREWVEGEIVVFFQEERCLQAKGSVLLDAAGKKCGVVIVLNDVTRIRKLENMRRDFVSNVSHELKTPITSIQGFIETLRDGAIEHAEDAKRFLGIIAKQADRLNSIIENLLNLSRIEQEGERGEILMEMKNLSAVVETAVQACAFKANTKGVSLLSQVSPDARTRVNASLLEQALINLIDNAINASDPKKEVQVTLQSTGEGIAIQVKDSGQGIAKEHLGRIFERFYRVDKARSRGRGGTGLGLAISKHIVQAHQGTIAVESVLGQGSVFTIRLPG